MEESDVVVIGAGPAGLAAAGCLIQRGLRPLVLERARELGASWRSHYERLHLHTVKTHSALPGLPFPASAPRYVSRQGVVDYLAAYAVHHRIAPRVGAEVGAIVPRDARWHVTTTDGQRVAAPAVVVATGANNRPNRPEFNGQASFAGRIVHSGDYRNAEPFRGRRVLVVGMGNTGAEIALDLAEHGVAVALSVRSPVNIVYRDVLGRPTQLTSMALARLPERWGDAIARWLCTVTVGDIGRTACSDRTFLRCASCASTAARRSSTSARWRASSPARSRCIRTSIAAPMKACGSSTAARRRSTRSCWRPATAPASNGSFPRPTFRSMRTACRAT